MNTNQLECFLAVASHLNFARAAEELHITQPAVTHQITALEAELGTKLFHRTTRLVDLTPDGMSFLPDAQNILQSARLAQARFALKDTDSFSTFSIGCHSVVELSLLPDILHQFTLQHPQVHPSPKIVPFRPLENLLENGALDVMFDYKTERRTKKDFAFFELIQTPIVCALSPSHPYARKKSIMPDELCNCKLILQEPYKIPPTLFAFQKPLAESHAPKDIYFCESVIAALTLAKAGLGIAPVPDIKPLRDNALCYIPLKIPVNMSYGIHYKKQGKSGPVKSFLEIAKKYFDESDADA